MLLVLQLVDSDGMTSFRERSGSLPPTPPVRANEKITQGASAPAMDPRQNMEQLASQLHLIGSSRVAQEPDRKESSNAWVELEGKST
jgi:hypothetical protein